MDTSNPTIISQQAADWVARLDADTPLSEAEHQAFRRWLERSPLHRQEVIRLNVFWSNKQLTELMVPLEKHANNQNRQAIARRPQWLRFKPALAISCLLLVAVALFIVPAKDKGSTANGLYATAVGQQNTLVLADGSTVQLNTNSQLKVSYQDNYRDIYLLQGEAYFTVAENSSRPFRVYANANRVLAVGTAFGVYIYNSNVDVTVTDGRVVLITQNASDEKNVSDLQIIAQYKHSDIDTPNVLNAGQAATIKSGSSNKASEADMIKKHSSIDASELSRRLSWRTGLLTFDGDNLKTVVDEISRYSGLRIDIVDPKIRNIRIGGQFQVGETEAMLRTLEATFGLKVTELNHHHLQLAMADNES